MPTTVADTAPVVPVPTPTLSDPRVRLERAGAALWRVRSRSGRLLGHVRRTGNELGTRYRAERLRATTGGFLNLGEFWNADEAVACLRYA